MKKMTLIAALKEHCMLPGEKLESLRQQYKELTDDDKAWFKAEFPAIGVEIVAPSKS
jgi:hypothetical protein